ncbi:MAG: hypothetical protein JSW08_01410 [archaeon]|nr:MAG: hypothetical protein JSW08_01410 [archaeon]
MKVSFYHVGNTWIALKAMFDKLKIPVVAPPEITQASITYGIKHSPEQVCEPFKYILGEYKQCLDAGADTFFYIGSTSREGCRLTQFGVGMKDILRRQGYKIDVIGWGDESLKKNYFQIKKAAPKLTFLQFTFLELWIIIKLSYIEWLEDFVNQLRPYAINPKDCSKLLKQGLELIDKSQNVFSLFSTKQKIKRLGKKIKQDRTRKPIPVIVVGDLYLVLEPAINNHIFEKLGEMGLIPYRSFYLSHFLRRSGKVIGPWGKNTFRYKFKHAKKYMDKTLTFGTLESVGDTVRLLQEKKIKGIVHMHSFTCMPEVINTVIYKKIAKDFNVPLLLLGLGEHHTEAHQETRLEAFVDVLKNG